MSAIRLRRAVSRWRADGAAPTIALTRMVDRTPEISGIGRPAMEKVLGDCPVRASVAE
jgi:hypothetical protein